MTAAEDDELDLAGRMEFSNTMHAAVRTVVGGSSNFAGIVVDQRANGSLTVRVADDDSVLAERILALAGPGPRTLQVRFVEHSFDELERAVSAVWERWPDLAPEASLISVSVDTAANGLRIGVALADLPNALSLHLATRLGVPVTVEAASPSVDQVCNSRDNCYSPMKAGSRIRHGSLNGSICGMSFHISLNGDEQLLTAGHCGYTGSLAWYHQGCCKVGDVKASYYVHGGIDLQRIQMGDSHASDDVYAGPYNITGSRYPSQGEAVCSSRSMSLGIDCGTIRDSYKSWTSSHCGCIVYGADHDNISTQPGDSGSPIYVGSTSAVAIGVHNTSAGDFARVQDAFPAWGAVFT
ncbi:MAG: hypothetical protein ACRDGD_03620 [Candidatus Limnocylindria bacterium]